MRNQVECIPPLSVEHVQRQLGTIIAQLRDMRDVLKRYTDGLDANSGNDRVLGAVLGTGLATVADDVLRDATETLDRLSRLDRDTIEHRFAEVRDLVERLGNPWIR